MSLRVILSRTMLALPFVACGQNQSGPPGPATPEPVQTASVAPVASPPPSASSAPVASASVPPPPASASAQPEVYDAQANAKVSIVIDGKPWDPNGKQHFSSTWGTLLVGSATANEGFHFNLARAPVGPFTSNVVLVEYLAKGDMHWMLSVDAKTTGTFRKIEPNKRGKGFFVSLDITTVLKHPKTNATKKLEAHLDDCYVTELPEGPPRALK